MSKQKKTTIKKRNSAKENENGKTFVEEEKVVIKKTIWNKPDIIDEFSYLMVIIFFIGIFLNITLLNSPISTERDFALKSLAIATMAVAGLGIKAWTDHAQIMKEEMVTPVYLTDTRFESLSVKSVGWTLLYFGIMFIAQFIVNIFITGAVPGFLFFYSNLTVAYASFAIISSISEELFFTYGIETFLLPQLKWATIPIVTGVFVLYHLAVYQNFQYLLFVALMRIIYATVYLFSRRIASNMLAHLLNNLLVSGLFQITI